MTEEQIAALKQENADLKAERASLKKALDDREADNKKARDQAKALQTELDEAKAKVPPEGSRVLTKDEAAALAAYEVLGKPNELEVKLGDYDRAVSDAATAKRQQLVDAAARDPQNETTYRYKPSVLARLLEGTALTKNDKGEYTVKSGDTEKALDKYLTEDQVDFLPALTVTTGTLVPKQAGARSNPLTTSVEDLAKAKAARGDYRA